MKQLSIDGTHSVLKLFVKEDVDVVLLADKTFLRFHETTSKMLDQKRVRHVGVALSVDEKLDVQ